MAVHSQFISVASHSTELASGWIYLVDWILVLILGVAFIFYFDRLLGFVLSLIARFTIWRTSNVMINVESIRLSVLGGRLMIKNLTVATENQTISVLRLNLTWRYWLWGLTRLPEYYIDTNDAKDIETEGISKSDNERLPARFLLALEGLEIFMYNRTFAYDNIMESLLKENDKNDEKSNADCHKEQKQHNNLRYRFSSNDDSTTRDTTTNGGDANHIDANLSSSSYSKSDDSSIQSGVDVEKLESKLSKLLRFFPLSVAIKKGVMVVGNNSTPSLLVNSCKSATGIIDIKKPSSDCDIYKQLFYFDMSNFQSSIKPNILYNKASEEHSKNNLMFNSKHNLANLKHQHSVSRFEKFQSSLKIFERFFKRLKFVKPDTSDGYEAFQKWTGLKRYLDQEDDYNNIFDGFSTDEEYAKSSLVIDTLSTKLSYYYDIPGPVNASELNSHPDYGADIEFSMATIHYGPWANNQRVPIQNMFFPPLARDSEPPSKPVPGQLRLYGGFKVNVFTNDEIIFRIPTREPSKDKHNIRAQNFNKNTQNQSQKPLRPFGWLELKLGPNSSVSLFVSFLCLEEHGWPNTLSAIFLQPELRSSVNHDILYMSDIHTIEADIGFPLKWNGECVWRFNNTSSNARIFFLREHTLLLSDMFTDFSSGPPTPYEQFRPFKYLIDWNFQNYKLYLNVNDANIINNPLDFNSNKYLSFQGEELTIKSRVPLMGQFTKLNTVEFDVFAPCFDLTLDLPPWHTQSAFVSNPYVLGRAHNFTINGSYSYYNNIEINTSNHIIIRCKGDDITLKMYGALVRYVFVIRENYLGHNFHFKTFEEYNNELQKNSNSQENSYSSHANSISNSLGDDVSTSSSETLSEEFDYWSMIKTDNDVDVLFSFEARNGLLVLPYDIYGCKSHIGLSFDYFDTDIRFTNYYMDMQSDFSTVSGKYVSLPDENEDLKLLDISTYLQENQIREEPHILIDELSVHGHRMFGVPPTEVTYFCNWRAATNSIKINSPPKFLEYLGQSVGTFVLSFKDLQNALSPIPLVHDALAFSFNCPEFHIRLNCEQGLSFIIELKPLLATVNDFNNKRYTGKVSVDVSSLEVKILDRRSGNLLSFFKSGFTFDNIVRKPKFEEHLRLQQEHIRFNDAPFHRVPFLLSEETKNDNYDEGYCSMLVPISLPDGHFPINRYTRKVYDAKNDSKISLSSSSSEESLHDFINIEDGRLFISPTLKYNEDDFVPESQNDARFKYDNMILTFNDVIGFVTPQSVYSFAMLQQELIETNFKVLIDSFEKKVVKNLAAKMMQICMNDSFRLVAPALDISFGNLVGTNEEELLKSSKECSVTNILVHEPSIAFSSSILRSKLASGEFYIEKEESSAFSVKNISISISSPKEFGLPINISIKDIEFWSNEDDKVNVFSLAVEDILLNLNESQFVWFVAYFDDISRQVEPALKLFEDIKTKKSRLEAALIYKLSVASRELRIDHDSEVLTKPAYLIRSLKQHIRFYDSWMVLVRLRHIFATAGKQWAGNEEHNLEKNGWKIPDSAYDETWDIFSNWRSWDADYQEREQMFQDIFGIKPLSERRTNGQVLVKHAAISWSNEETLVNDYIDFQDINTSFSSRRNDALFSQLNHELANDFDARVKSFEMIINLGVYRGNLSPITLNVLPSLIKELERVFPVQDATSDQKGKVNNSAMFFVVNVNEFQQRLMLDYLTLDLHCNEFSTTGVSQIIESDKLMSFTTKIPIFGLELHAGNKSVVTSGIDDFKFVYGNGKAPNLMYLLNLCMDNCFLEVFDENLSQTITKLVEEDMKYFDIIMSNHSNNPEKGKGASTLPETNAFGFAQLSDILNTVNANVNIQVNHFSYLIKVLKHIAVDGSLYDENFSLVLTDGVIDIGALLQKTDLNLRFKDSEILKLENSQLFTNIRAGESSGVPMIKVDSQFGFSKLFMPKLLKCTSELIDYYPEVKLEMDTLISNIKGFVIKEESMATIDPKSQQAKTPKFELSSISLDFKFSNDYIGISFIADRTKYSLEVEDSAFRVSNVSNKNNLNNGPYVCTLLVPSTRLSIVDRIIPLGLSNFVDINMSVKAVNEEGNDKLQLLEVLSQFCRICLSFGIIQRLVYLADELTILGKKLTSILRMEGEREEPPKPANAPISPSLVNKKLPILSSITSIHFLSYNFCIGWIFEDPRPNYPGLILGAERFYAVTDENIGKLSLIDAYLSVAHGESSTSFFSSQSEKHSSNRAFLPFMQFIYIITENEDSRDMKITITGDELDVNYLSDAFHILDSGIKSVSSVQAYFNKRVRPLDKWQDNNKTHEEQQVDYINSLRSTFSSIECKATFAGSNVLLHRLGDDNIIDNEHKSSLFLHFPAVKSYTSYVHDKIGPKKHIIKSEMLTSSSDNKLYAACVPVIMDILEEIKGMMRRQNPSNLSPNTETSYVQDDSKQLQRNIDFSSLLNETEIHLGLRIEKQKLSFSCEPTAKVEAVVGIEGIGFQINSGPNSSINAVAILDTISASLQHVYSREVSGSIGINTVSLSGNAELGNELNIRFVGAISNFDGYVNVKQYQDLDLFKDIWYPKSSKNTSSFDDTNNPEETEPPVLASNRSIASRVTEVSNTNAVPWFLTFLLSNVSIKVNCGPSLGEMTFGLEQLWVVSKKTPDWTQQLKLGINCLQLTSEGRLGGEVIVRDIYLHSAITWKLDDGSTLDVPLIVVSLGIEKLKMKSTFDYHMFAVANIVELSIDLFNQKSEQMISKERLFAAARFKTFELFMTSFTASNVLDIYNAMLRMTQENKISYKETLHDSNKGKKVNDILGKSHESAILETVKKLETEFEVLAGTFLIHVYPSSFDDSKVLVIKLDESSANFQQNEYNKGISNQLDIQFNDLSVSLSVNTPISEEFIQEASVEEFSKYAHKARGGNIFLFPSFQISMKTFQRYNSNLIEYLYKTTFGGTVDIRWNLGSVNFIREMYSIHSKSLASRTEFRNTLKKHNDEINFKEHIFDYEIGTGSTPSTEDLIEHRNSLIDGNLEKNSTEQIDQAINNKIDKVSKDSKYSYLPLAPPIIEVPQLKELGNATPPLEWFGLHRNNFPNVTHELGIVTLQKLIHELELEYSKILGKA